MLALVESTRVEAFRIRRSEVDRGELAERLAGLDPRSANHVIRAFSHFSLLANIAEDVHHERRRRHHRREGSPPQKGSLAAVARPAGRSRLDPDVVARELAGALVVPGRHRAPHRGAAQDDLPGAAAGQRPAAAATGGRDVDERAWSAHLWREVLTLWQTALLRLSPAAAGRRDRRGAALLRPLAVRGRPGDQRRAAPGAGRALAGRRPAGRPDAPAGLVDRRRPRRQPVRHRRRRPPGHHPPGRDGAAPPPRPSWSAWRDELSMSDRLVTPDRRAATRWPRPPATTRRSAPTSPTGGRCAASTARLAATALRGAGRGARRRAGRRPAALRLARPSCSRDLDVVDHSLRRHGAGALADDRLARLREAVEVFGFHLCGLDMRQNSAVHEEVARRAAGLGRGVRRLRRPRRGGAGRAAHRRAAAAPAAGAPGRRAVRPRPRRAGPAGRRGRAGRAARAATPSRTT